MRLLALNGLDTRILFFLNHLGHEGLARETVIRVLATGSLYVLGVILLYLLVRKPDGRRVLAAAVISGVLALIAGKIINQVVPRERPFVALPGQVRYIALIVRPDSFPSIHAVVAFALSGSVLFSRHRRWGAVMLILATLMALARVASGVHWPSDVAGGAAIGLLAAALVACIPRSRKRRSEPAPATSANLASNKR